MIRGAQTGWWTVLASAALAVLWVGSPVEGWAQTEVEAGLSFQLGLPQDAFERNVDNTGIGFGAFGALRPGGGPVLLGADMGFVNYGRNRRETRMANIPEIELEVRTDNNIFMGHTFLRLQPSDATVRPYADLLFGFKYLFTESRVRGVDSDPDDDFARTVNLDDWAVSYGAGAGLDFTVTSSPAPADGESRRIRYFKVHLGARYLAGGEAEYLREDSMTHRGDDGIEYEMLRSRTNLVQPVIGATFVF